MKTANDIYADTFLKVESQCTGKNPWGANHVSALRFPRNDAEKAIGLMVKGLVAYVDSTKAEWGDHVGNDYVLGVHVKELAQAVLGLLNGPTGRLDCGTLDGLIRDVCELAGIDLDK